MLNEVARLTDVKLENSVFEKESEKTRNDLQALQFGINDLNNALMQTDNYIEKFLPYKTQNILSETLN